MLCGLSMVVQHVRQVSPDPCFLCSEAAKGSVDKFRTSRLNRDKTWTFLAIDNEEDTLLSL